MIVVIFSIFAIALGGFGRLHHVLVGVGVDGNGVLRVGVLSVGVHLFSQGWLVGCRKKLQKI